MSYAICSRIKGVNHIFSDFSIISTDDHTKKSQTEKRQDVQETLIVRQASDYTYVEPKSVNLQFCIRRRNHENATTVSGGG